MRSSPLRILAAPASPTPVSRFPDRSRFLRRIQNDQNDQVIRLIVWALRVSQDANYGELRIKMIRTIDRRRERILALISEAGEETSVSDLVRRLGRVSAITVRRDIAFLAGKGRVERTHGGAMLPRDGSAPAEDAVFPKEASLQDELDGIDAIVLPPIGGRGAETLRMLARRRRIPFLAESAPQEGGVYLGPDNFTAGRELGRVAGCLLAGRIDEARLLLVSLESLPNTRARCDGFIKGFT